MTWLCRVHSKDDSQLIPKLLEQLVLSWTKQIDLFSLSFNEELRLKGKEFLANLEDMD